MEKRTITKKLVEYLDNIPITPTYDDFIDDVGMLEWRNEIKGKVLEIVKDLLEEML